MVARSWAYPLYKKVCLGENGPTQVFFLWIALEGLVQSRKLFYLQESLSPTEMSPEFGHFQPEL